VQSKQSVDQKRPLPLGALRQLPHFASRSYATGSLSVKHIYTATNGNPSTGFLRPVSCHRPRLVWMYRADAAHILRAAVAAITVREVCVIFWRFLTFAGDLDLWPFKIYN